QNTADWTYILSHGLGWGYEDDAGYLGATAMILPYGERVAWICMVLVTASWRNRGIATALLRHCIAQAEDRGWVPGLDATEAGRQVYLPMGFCDILSLTRFKAEPFVGLEKPHDRTCRPMTKADLPAVVRLDEATAGASRAGLLESLHLRTPSLCWVVERDGIIEGFCMGRDGCDADQIGPIVSANDETAIALIGHALQTRPEPLRRIYIDALTDQKAFCLWLGDQGFEKQRGFSRMLKGRSTPLGDPAPLFAIAGPELG
ncbi:MAG TPA: GNAT family N-acetyltransferase, partial [Rhodospirillales bacterium]|nr:GNAT family N-acetyltransferase [Rhodospirillales bacterium]